MQQKSKRILVVLLAVLLTLTLGAGALFVILPNSLRKSGKIAELSEDDFEFRYGSLAYSADTEETSGSNGVYGWGYDNEDKDAATYCYITKIDNSKLADLKAKGVTKIVLNIPETHNGVSVLYVQQDAFNNCELTITNINMPLSVYWQIRQDKSHTVFTLGNDSAFARADGMTATFTEFKPASGSGITTLILPSNVWIDKDGDGVMDGGEPTYRYTEYLFEGNSGATYTNLVVMPDVVNIFNGKETDGHPKLQGGLLSKSKSLESVYFCTGRSEILHLFPLTFENCTALKEISLSAGVFLEDGARVFQGSSDLEKFFVAEEKNTAAPLFYTVGADGALYTNDYAYNYFTQSNTEKYYEWWNKGNPKGYEGEQSPIKAYDNQRPMDEDRLEHDSRSDVGGKADLTLHGDPDATTAPTREFKAQTSSGKYEGGIGVPEGSYVFDVNGPSDSENDFSKGTAVGQYETSATFESATLTTKSNADSNGTTASISVSGGSITVTEVGGNTQSDGTITINDVEYKSRMQFKKSSTRYLEIKVPFDFDLCVYFAGNYTASQIDATHPQLALFNKDGVTIGKDKKYTKTTNALATLDDVKDVNIKEDGQHLLKIEGSKLASGTYYVAQPSDDTASSGYAQMFFLVITPVKEQSASSIVVEQALTTKNPDPAVATETGSETEVEWERVRNDSVLLSGLAVGSDRINTYVDRKHPSLSFNGDSVTLYFRIKLLSATGDIVKSQDVQTHALMVDNMGIYNDYIIVDDDDPFRFSIDDEGYFHFHIQLYNNLFSYYESSSNTLSSLVRNGLTAVIRINAGSVQKDLYVNFSFPTLRDETKIPDPASMTAASGTTTTAGSSTSTTVSPASYLSLTSERAVRYERLVSMPAKAQNDQKEYVNSFTFNYRETVEIGPNAFQNTFITVIDIPDRIAKIGASAFRFSDRLQTVYLPEKAEIALNAFGQEADADTVNGTVFTAGKKNFFLIAPSRISYEAYMNPSAGSPSVPSTGEGVPDTPAVPADVNYNTFPIHVEAEVQGFQDWAKESGRGKDASYDYTPYLTYEISVNFLTYNSANTVIAAETRSFLYGQDAHFVKATETTEWAKFDGNYDNNAPVYFGYISDNKVQQINTMATDIPWSVAAGGWYYDENASFPQAETWYYGSAAIYSLKNEQDSHVEKYSWIPKRLTEFFSGNGVDFNDNQTPNIGVVNPLTVENRAKAHYTEVFSVTHGMTATGSGEEDDALRPALDTTETHKTMPISITLKSIGSDAVDKIALDVPDFQLVGDTMLDATVYNMLEPSLSYTGNPCYVPKLTVTFDFNGFAPSRIFDGFNSSAMEVAYLRQYDYDSGVPVPGKNYNYTQYGWATDEDWPEKASIGNKFSKHSYNGAPYDVGRYLIKLTLTDTEHYTWGGAYDGVHVAANDTEAKYFLLEIQTRRIKSYPTPTYVDYTGEECRLFENNPYVSASYSTPYTTTEDFYEDTFDGAWWATGALGPNGLPCETGVYKVQLAFRDPSGHTGNLEWSANGNKGTGSSGEIRLYIIDEKRPMIHKETSTHEMKYDAPMVMFIEDVKSFTYNGAPRTIQEVFADGSGNEAKFNEPTTEYTLTRDGVPVTEIKEVGTYVLKITPVEGYVWWRGYYRSGTDSWSMDAYWEKLGGDYDSLKTATLTFTFTVEPKKVSVPKDSYIPKNVDPPYTFPELIGGDYEVVGYNESDLAVTDPSWSASAPLQGNAKIYSVLLRLTDPKNCMWYPNAGTRHGGNYYQTVHLYVGFDREKAYPEFKEELGKVDGTYPGDELVTLTRTYDGTQYNISALFKAGTEFSGPAVPPTDAEANYTIYKLSGVSTSVEDFTRGERTSYICDAGDYGIVVTLKNPFLFVDTGETVAYYLVHIEEAEIMRNTGSSFAWDQNKVYHVGDDPVALTLPALDGTGSPLNIVSAASNDPIVTYHLVTEAEDTAYTPASVLTGLRGGADEFHGDWYLPDERLQVTAPGAYFAFVKVEAANHTTYYDCVSLHIYHEEYEITLNSGAFSRVYGESVHTQEALRAAVLEATESVQSNTVTAGVLSKTGIEKTTLNNDSFHFFFTKDGAEYDFGTEETYLDVGKYELHVRYVWDADAPAESVNYITFQWDSATDTAITPTWEITTRPLALDLGTITGHTYLDEPQAKWYEEETFTYKDDPAKTAIVKGDDLQLSYRFKNKAEETFPSLTALSDAGVYTVEVSCGNPNYTVELKETYTYTVAARELSLNPVANVTYDGNAHAPVITFEGMPAGRVLTADDYTVSYAPVVDTGAELDGTELPLKAGSYTVTVTLTSTNYTFAAGKNSATLDFTIEKAVLPTPYLALAVFPYTENDVTATVIAALINYDADKIAYALFTTKDGTGEDLREVTDAGTYFLKVTLKDDNNYTWKEGAAGTDVKEIYLQFSVEKVTLPTPYLASTVFSYTENDVKADVMEALKNYNAGKMACAFYAKNDGTGESLREVTDAGTYFLKVTLQNDNYQWEGDAEGTYVKEIYLQFTVAKRAGAGVTITAENVTLTYGDPMKYPTVTLDGAPEGAAISYFFTYKGSEGTEYESPEAPANVGTYEITVTAVYAGSDSREPFSVTTTATLTINAKVISLNEVASATYNGGEQQPAITFADMPLGALVEGKDYEVSYTANSGTLGDAGLPRAAGSYTVKVTLISENYTFAEGENSATKEFTIEKAIVEKPSGDNRTFVYNGALQTYTVAENSAYTVSGNTQVNASETGYEVKVSLKDKNNYEWKGGGTEDLIFSFVIKKATVVRPSADSKTFVYTGTEQTYAVAENSAYTVSGNTQTNANEAGYTVTVKLNDPSNYEWAGGGTDDITFLFKIARATVSAVWEETNYVYTGSVLPMPKATAQGLGKDGKFDLDVALTSPKDGEFKNAGNYTFTATLSAQNYILSSVGATQSYTVEKATVGKPSGDNRTFVYNGAAQTYAVAENSAYTVSDNTWTDANEKGYTVTVKLKDKNNYKWADGKVDDITFLFVIEKATVSAVWEGANYVYTGSVLSMPKATAQGFGKNKEITLLVALNASAGTEFKNAGNYTFTATLSADYAKNYTLAGATQSYTVEKATVSAVWEETNYTYTGSVLPMPKATAQGLGENEEITLLVTLPSGEFKNVGNYTFTAALKAEYAQNYTLVGAEKTYAVAKRDVTPKITAKDVTVIYGDPTQYPEVELQGVLASYDVSILYTYQGINGTSYASSSEAPANVGTYAVTVKVVYAGSANDEAFTVTATATLTINARTIGVELDSAAASYDGAEKQPAVTFTGMPEGRMLTEGKDYTVSYAANTGARSGGLPLAAGSYTVTVTLTSENYTFANGKSATLTFTVERTTLALPKLSPTAFVYTGENLMESVRAALVNATAAMDSAFYTKNDGTGSALAEVKNAGNYFLKVTLSDLGYQWEGGKAEVYLPFTVEKAIVDKPSEDETAFVYTGTEQTYAVASNAAYTVTGNKQTDANESGYTVTVSLINKNNYVWADGKTDDVIFLFKIAKKAVDKPSEDETAFVYTGTEQTYIVAANAAYTVSGNKQTDANESGYTVTVSLIDKKNYVWAEGGVDDVTFLFKIAKATVSAMWNGPDYTYTGSVLPMPEATARRLGKDGEFALDVTLNMAAGTEFKNAGDYTFTAALKAEDAQNYTLVGAEKTYTVAKKAVLKPSEDKTAFVYTGAEQTYTVASNAAYTVSGNKQTDANESGYTVTVSLSDPVNYEWADGETADITFLFKIAKANYDLSGVRFADKTVGYDGEKHSVFITGDLPAGVQVSYKGNEKTGVGEYRVTAAFTGDTANYNPIPSMFATLTIRYGYDFDGVTFENATVKYDGNAHAIYLQGELPEGVYVTYEGNEQTDPGIYAVKAIFNNALGKVSERTAVLTILRTHAQVAASDGAPIVVIESEEGFDPTLELVLETSGDVMRTVWAWERDRFSEKYVVKFIKDGAEVPFEGTVTVRLLIPSEVRGEAFTLQSMGRAAVEYTRDGDYVVFEVNGLATYEFACTSVPYLPIILIAAGVVLISAAVLAVWGIAVKKKKEGEE